MEALHIAPSDDSPEISLDQSGNKFEISGKSLPEDVVDFYQPVLDWLTAYAKAPNPRTVLDLKFLYFNTASSKLIMDILMILENMVEEGHDVIVRWHSLSSDEDMQEAGQEYDEMIEVPFEHHSYEL